MEAKQTAITLPLLQQMKKDGKKIVGVVAWDYQMAQIVDHSAPRRARRARAFLRASSGTYPLAK